MNKHTSRGILGSLILPTAFSLTFLVGCGGGSSGTAGLPGPTGLTGAPGATGPQGAQGAPGQPGTQGAGGSGGATGAQGATGSSGAPGTVAGGHVFVATSNGIEAIIVDPSGNIVDPQDAVPLPNSDAPLGLAVTPNQKFLIATCKDGLFVFSLDPQFGSLLAVNTTPVAGSAPPSGSIAIDPSSSAGVFGDTSNHLEGFTLNEAGAITAGGATANNNYPNSAVGGFQPGVAVCVSVTNVGGNDIASEVEADNQGTFNVVSFTLTVQGALQDLSNGGNGGTNFGNFANEASINFVTSLGNQLLVGCGATNEGDIFPCTVDASGNLTVGSGNSLTFPNAAAAATSGILANLPGSTNPPLALVTTNDTSAQNDSVNLLETLSGVNTDIGFSAPSTGAAVLSSALLLSQTGSSIAVVTDASNTVSGFLLDGSLTSKAVSPAVLNVVPTGTISTVTPNNIGAINLP